MLSAYQNDFIKLFKEICPHENRYSIFRDWVTMCSLSIQNSVLKNHDIEERYLDVAKKYSKDELTMFSELLAKLVMGLDNKPTDFLGSVFMDLDLGNKYTAQFFTPYSLSLAIAKIQVDGAEKIINEKGYITVSEPSCGAGGMIIAFTQALLEKGVNPQNTVISSCVDIDPVAAYMCYLQLSLLGLPSEIFVGNTLSMEFSEVLRTPFYYIGGWHLKSKLGDIGLNKSVPVIQGEIDEQISLLEFA